MRESIPASLTLWPSWDSAEGLAFVTGTLLVSGDDADREFVASAIELYINGQQIKAQSELRKIVLQIFPAALLP